MPEIAIQSLITSIMILSLGIFVFCFNTRSQKNISFFIFTLSVFIWYFSLGISFLPKASSTAELIIKFGLIGAIFIVVTAYHFVASFLKRDTEKKFVVIAYIIGLVFALLVFFSTLFMSQILEFHGCYYPVSGILHPVYIIFLLILVARMSHLLYKNFTRTKSTTDEKNRSKYMFFAIAVFSFAAVDFLTNLNFNIYPFGFIFVLCYAFIATYAIVKHKLLNIEVIIKKTFVYSVAIFAITIIYFMMVYSVEKLLSSVVGYNSSIVAVIVIVTLSIIFMPLKNRLQKFTDRYFFRGSIDQINSENFKLREELQKNEKLKAIATLAAGMAHEIKNPLTSIKTFTEFVDKKKDDPEFMRKFRTIVGSEIDKINNIVKQLLEFSRPSDLDLKESNINTLLDETLDLLNNDLLKKNIKIYKHYTDLPLINIDPSQMKQVFLNLFLNAIDAMPEGGKLTVSTAMNETTMDQDHIGLRTVRIAFQDTGSGMSPEVQAHLFEPFFTTKEGGSGLGLSISYGIIQSLGGLIEVASVPGSGSTFTILLPADAS